MSRVTELGLKSRFSTETQFNQSYTVRDGIKTTPAELRLCLRCMSDIEFDTNSIEINIIIACLMKLLMDYHKQIRIWKSYNIPPPFIINNEVLLVIKTSTNEYEYADRRRERNIYNDPRNGIITVNLEKTIWIESFIESLNKENEYNNKNILLENIDQLTHHIYHNIKYKYNSSY